MEQEMSAMGITRSERVYLGPESRDKGKAPAAAFSAISEAAPLHAKKVTDQEVEAFMKVIKASEYKVVEQMGKSPAHISLLALLLSPEPHRDALLKVLTVAQVSKETTPDRIEETVNSIFSNQISFAKDELPSEGQGHLWALHIVCKCNNHVIGRVMIDNSSALNVCPVSTLKQMNGDMGCIRASKTTVRAFDGSRREVNEEINLLIDNDYAPGTRLGARAQGILRPIEVEEYRNRRGLGFRPSCHEIVQAHRGKHLYRLAAHHGKLSKGILVPPLSHFFPAPPEVMGGTSDSPSTESDDSSSDAVEAFLALPAINVVTEETSSGVYIRLAREDEELTNWTAVPLYSAMVADVLQSNPNHGCNDSNSSETHLGKSLPIYFGEGLDEDDRVPEIEVSLHRLENHQLTSVEPTEEIDIGTTEDQRTLKIETGLELAQRSRMIDFLTEYQEEEVIKQMDVRFLEVCNYSEWVANIVPVEKKNGKVRVCIDYRDLNWASPKDNFPLPHIDVLVDNTARHTQFSFMDGFFGCNQIQMAEEDKVKTMFIMMWGTFYYKVMPFSLKNAGATYQRAMVTLFHDMMHKEIEVYVDDMIAKSKEGDDYLVNLKQLFEHIKKYKLRLNLTKCTFGVKSGKLLGFVVSEKGIEVDPDKVKAIGELPPLSTVREVRSFLGRLNYIARFIANLMDKGEPLFLLLRKNAAIEWDDECQKAFDTCCQLTEYDIEYVSRTLVKGQAIADHLAEFPIDDDTPINSHFPEKGILQVSDEEETPGWKMYFYGAVLISPEGHHFPVASKIDFPYTNNVAEYEACILGLQALTENFEDISFTYTPHMKNRFADALATLASMVSITKENLIEPLEFEIAKGPAHCNMIEVVDGKPWYADIKHLLQTGQFPAFTDRHDRRTLRRIAAHFFLSGETLYRRSFDATLLRCVDKNEAQRLMEEVHEGNYGPHINGLMLAKKLIRLGYFWSTMETDC
ncbi:hypothetical protein CRG98_011365, partial [Punica granatum]